MFNKYLLLLGILAVLCFTSCKEVSGEIKHRTYIIADNSANPFKTSLYWHKDREDAHKIATVEKHQYSTEIKFSPFEEGRYFFPIYYIWIEEHEIELKMGDVFFKIPEGVTTHVFIRPLPEVVSEVFPEGGTLINDIFLYIRNSGSSGALRLLRNNSIVTDNNEQHIVVNPGNNGLFKNPRYIFGDTSNFSIVVGSLGSNPFPFPYADLPILKPGHFYFLVFNGTNVTFLRETPISLQSAMYTVTFNINDGYGNTPINQMIDKGSGVILPDGSGFSREEHVFRGWNTKADGTGINYNENTFFIPDSNMTLYARWFTFFPVTFDANGGIPSSYTQLVAQEDGHAIEPSVMKTGYTLDGWYRESDYNKWNFSNDIVTNAITLYAKWTPIVYTVCYDKNASDALGFMDNSIYTYNVEKNLNAIKFSRTGYSFLCWNTRADGKGENYTNSQNVKNLTSIKDAVVTLYAIWFNIRFPSVKASSVTLSWDNINIANGYNIYRSQSEDGLYTKINAIAVIGTEFTDSGAMPDTTYYYKISAINGDVESLQSSPVSVTTLSSVPTNIRIISESTIRVVFEWETIEGAMGYNIYRSDSENGIYIRVNNNAVIINEFTDTGLKGSTLYFYKIRAVFGDFEGLASLPLSVATISSDISVIKFEFIDPADFEPELPDIPDIIQKTKDSHTFIFSTIGDGWSDEYQWYLNGVKITTVHPFYSKGVIITDNSIEINWRLPVGYYEIAVIATRENVPYSASVSFKVLNTDSY